MPAILARRANSLRPCGHTHDTARNRYPIAHCHRRAHSGNSGSQSISRRNADALADKNSNPNSYGATYRHAAAHANPGVASPGRYARVFNGGTEEAIQRPAIRGYFHSFRGYSEVAPW